MQFTDGIQEKKIWEIGDIVGKEREKAALAKADLTKSSVLSAGLSVALTPGLHPLHADVGGWPAEKDEQKLIALDLCAKSKLSLRPATLYKLITP